MTYMGRPVETQGRWYLWRRGIRSKLRFAAGAPTIVLDGGRLIQTVVQAVYYQTTRIPPVRFW